MPGRSAELHLKPGHDTSALSQLVHGPSVTAPGHTAHELRFRTTLALLTLLLVCVPLAACSKDGTGPATRQVRIAAVDGDGQFGLAQATLELSLTAQVVDATSGSPVKDVSVTWRVVTGAGAAVTPAGPATDGAGMASARLRLGSATGEVQVEANATGMVSGPALFRARVVLQPTLQSVAPQSATAGSTVVITGSNFSDQPGDHTVLFGGLRGRVTAATATRLDVEVPRCALTRDVQLTVALGAVVSGALSVRTIAGAPPVLTLGVGQARTFSNAADFDCIALDGVPSRAEYLVLAQDVAQRVGYPSRLELQAIAAGGAPAALESRPVGPSSTVSSEWEWRLRAAERAFGPGEAAGMTGSAQAGATAITPPTVGDRRSFNVLTRDLKSKKITAEARVVSSRAALYIDTQTPAGAFTDADLTRFGQLFDDPIYATEVGIFGAPSDMDANGVVIIVFTPAVNELTDRNASGFIAGYFYGCDLVAATRCKDTNSGEIFYSMVPDPTGQFSGARSKDTVLRTVPGVLAHEFQHMIHFSRRGGSLDVLWLAEGLAHAAEDVVGEVFRVRGDAVTANEFQRPNHVRMQLFLARTTETALVSEDSPGSLELRGAAWLFTKYLMGHYGGNDLLGNITGMTGRGATNIVAATGRPWSTVLGEFAVASWADDAPELSGTTIDPRFRFSNLNVRAILTGIGGGYPLQPVVMPFGDFRWTGLVSSAGVSYVRLVAPATAPPRLHLALTGLRGAAFPAGSTVQLTVLRVR